MQEKIAAIDRMTLQQIFNKVARHLMKQGKAKRKQLVCDDGTRCAIGCLLPENLHDRSGIVLSYNNYPQRLIEQSTRSLKKQFMLEDLLVLHDNCKEDTWPEELLAISQEYGLNPNAIWS